MKRIINFFNQVLAELRKVEWLGGKKTLNFTLIVLFFIFFGTLMVLFFDQIFLTIKSLLIN